MYRVGLIFKGDSKWQNNSKVKNVFKDHFAWAYALNTIIRKVAYPFLERFRWPNKVTGFGGNQVAHSS